MAAFTVIAHTEATGATASWEKTSIPSSYDHLLIRNVSSGQNHRTGSHDGMSTHLDRGNQNTATSDEGI